MIRRLSIADFVTTDEAAHLAVAIRAYRRARRFAVPHSLAEIESELAQAAMGRQDPTPPAEPAPIGDGEPMTTDVLTIEQVAQRLQCSPRTVERRIAANVLPAIRDGRLVRVRQQDLDTYLAPGDTAC